MLVLAIWLFILGYGVAWTGAMNLGLTYQPQKDGSIKAVDDKGNPAKTYSLMDAMTCGTGATQQSNPAGIGISRTSTPAPVPAPVAQPNLIPVPQSPPAQPILGGIYSPFRPQPIPIPNPKPKPGPIGDIEVFLGDVVTGLRLTLKL